MRAQLMIGRRCQIQAGRTEFLGRVGTVVAREGAMYRIKLLAPVNVAVSEVKHDLWERRDFRLLPRMAENTRPRAKAVGQAHLSSRANKGGKRNATLAR